MENTNQSADQTKASDQPTVATPVAAADKALGELQAKLDTALSDSARKDLDLAEATKVIEGQKATIEQHETTISTLQGVKSNATTVTVGKEVYAITAKSAKLRLENGEDRTVTAEEIVKDKTLAAQLVKKGVGFLELVSPKESK